MIANRALRVLACRVSAALQISTLLVSSIRVLVEGESMLPVLADQDRLLVSRSAYRFSTPRRGDIVLLRDPSRPGYECIKRIVALPRERIRLEGLSVTVMGPNGCSKVSHGKEWQLGEAEYFVVGDNVAHSQDSRTFGPVRRADLRGPVWYRYSSRSLGTGRL